MAIKNCSMNIQRIEVSKDKKVLYCDDKIITSWDDGRTTTETVTNPEAKNCNCSMNIQSIENSPNKKVWICDDKIITFWDDGRTTTETVTNPEAVTKTNTADYPGM